MKAVVQIIRAIVIVFLCVNLFTWGTTHLYGHDIPRSTDIFFGLNGIVLLALAILFNYLHNRNKQPVE